MAWIYIGVAAVLGALAALWLSRHSYREADNVIHRRISPWWAPVATVLAAILAGPFFALQPPVVVVTYLLALVWAVVLVMIDLELWRLPDVLTLPAYPVAAALLAVSSVATSDDGSALLRQPAAG